MDSDKLYKILMSDNLIESIKNNIDFLKEKIPELNTMIGFEQKNPAHYKYLWENHVLLALRLSEKKVEKDFDVRLSLLLHDIGKPDSYQSEYDNEKEFRHYKGHPIKSEEISRKILKRFNYDEDYINYICELIELHDTPITDEQIKERPEFVSKLFMIQRCDALAHHPSHLKKRIRYLNETQEKINGISKSIKR